MNNQVSAPLTSTSTKNLAYYAGLNSTHYVQRKFATTAESVDVAIAQCPDDYQRGLGQRSRKRTTNDNFTAIVPLLAQTASKREVHNLIRDRIATTWADKPEAKLRILTLPGPLFKFEEYTLAPQSPIQSKIAEYVVMENCTTRPYLPLSQEQKDAGVQPSEDPNGRSPQEMVAAKARALRKEFPNTDFTVFKGSDYEILSTAKGRLTLRPNTGFDMVWLDWMTFWQAAQERAVNNLCLDADVLFQRSWKQGKPGLLFLTMRPQLETAKDLQVLARASQAMPNLKASHQLKNTKHAARVLGIASILNYHGALRGLFFKPVVNHFYKEGKDHCLMWLSGYEVYQANSVPSMELTATFDTPKTRS